MNESDAKKILEAVLFSTPDIVTIKALNAVLGGAAPAALHTWIEELNREYESTSRTFRIVRIGEGFQMRTLPMYKTWILKAQPYKPSRLSPAILETLAIVAYRQPITRAEVEHLRGVDASFALRTLLDRKLVRIIGKDTTPGRPILYGTTREFLSLFNLPDLKELPTLEDLDLSPGQPAAQAGEAPPEQLPLADAV